MLVLPEIPHPLTEEIYCITPVNPHRFLELALKDKLDARIPWTTALALSQILQVPFPTIGEHTVDRLPEEMLVASYQQGQLKLLYITRKVLT